MSMANGKEPRRDRVVPCRMAHFVIKTNNYAEMVSWYQLLFLADIVFANGEITFLNFDDEHHRLAIVSEPTFKSAPKDVNCIDHVAFSFHDLDELFINYERLKRSGVTPTVAIDHGPTTSLYYSDPDGNRVELQVDNFPNVDETIAFFRSSAFASNYIGTRFDPEEMLKKRASGV
jgi:catechol-2,3-dioxygenase